MLVFQSTSMAALSAVNSPTRTERNAKHLIGKVYLEQIDRPKRAIPPLITLTLHKMKATRTGLRVEASPAVFKTAKGRQVKVKDARHVYIPWNTIVKNCIPDPVGRVLDSGGTVPMSTMTIHAKVAAELGLVG